MHRRRMPMYQPPPFLVLRTRSRVLTTAQTCSSNTKSFLSIVCHMQSTHQGTAHLPQWRSQWGAAAARQSPPCHCPAHPPRLRQLWRMAALLHSPLLARGCSTGRQSGSPWLGADLLEGLPEAPSPPGQGMQVAPARYAGQQQKHMQQHMQDNGRDTYTNTHQPRQPLKAANTRHGQVHLATKAAVNLGNR